MSTVPAILTVDAFGRLVLAITGGAIHTDVTPVRCFPLTDPDAFISFCDARGAEVWSLRDPKTLAAEDRAILEAELARREFIPEIRRIRDIAAGAEPTSWEVETDRGASRFTLPSEDHVRRLGPDGALVVDAQGVRYRIRSLRTLDRHSLKLLRRYL